MAVLRPGQGKPAPLPRKRRKLRGLKMRSWRRGQSAQVSMGPFARSQTARKKRYGSATPSTKELEIVKPAATTIGMTAIAGPVGWKKKTAGRLAQRTRLETLNWKTDANSTSSIV